MPLIGDRTGSNDAPMLFVAACVFAGGVATFAILAALARRRHELPGVAKASNPR